MAVQEQQQQQQHRRGAHTTWPEEQLLDAPHTCPLRRALSGPCTRHLVLCQGLRTLCALDGEGGHYYGLPEEAGLQHMPVVLDPTATAAKPSGRERQSPGVTLLAPQSLNNLIVLLAMQPSSSEAGGGEAEPPDRATRLHLMLRVARAAAAAAGVRAAGAGVGGGSSGAGSSGGSGAMQYGIAPLNVVRPAMCALEFAWRLMPPRGVYGSRRRDGALRRWAQAAAEVAGGLSQCWAALHDWDERTVIRLGGRLGQLLGLNVDAVPQLDARGGLTCTCMCACTCMCSCCTAGCCPACRSLRMVVPGVYFAVQAAL